MDMMGKIRRLHFRGRLSFSEIARRMGLSRNTVKKWIKAPAATQPRYRRSARAGKLTAWHDTLIQALRADARRPRHERRSGRALHAQIKAEGYTGSYSRVTDFIRAWRQGGDETGAPRAFVPLAFELGEAFQFDWSEEGLVVGGIYRRLQVAHLKLCASRAFSLAAYPSQGHEMLFDAHTRSFEALGGIPRRGIYDNMKTAVDKVHKGKGRTVNARFAVMCSHYPNRVVIAAGDAIVAEHERLSGEGQTHYDWQHYLPLVQRKPGALRNGAPFRDLPEALQRLRRGLLREPGGDRVMAQVLALVPGVGLEAVLVAVELALESGPPSGRVSVEHVLNVLARLSAPSVPEQASTALRASVTPLADTARYDRLRALSLTGEPS